MIKASRLHPVVLVLSRLKSPLTVLSAVMMIAVVGLLLIPGQTLTGEDYYLTALDAIFIVSYTATTIGFGEIPYPFTDPQKVWLLFVVYTAVVSWIYTIGSIVQILQDNELWRSLNEYKLEKTTSRLKQDFYIILGFGRTGEWISHVLDNHGNRVVIVDDDSGRLLTVLSKKYNKKVMYIAEDYSSIRNIKMAGIQNKYCKGVFIVGRDFDKNLKAQLICQSFAANTIIRAENKSQESKLKLAGGTKVINLNSMSIMPIYNVFARPHIYSLASMIDKEFYDDKNYIKIPKKGKYLLYTDKASYRNKISKILKRTGNTVTILEEVTKEAIMSIDKDIVGVIVAGRDQENLVVLDRCRELIGAIYTIAINRKYTLSELYYGEYNIDLLIKPWLLFVEQSFALITEPLITTMMVYLSKQPPENTNIISSKIMDIYIDNEENAITWSKVVTERIEMDDFVSKIGSKRDHVIIFTKNLNDDLSSGMLDAGDIVLMSSRNKLFF